MAIELDDILKIITEARNKIGAQIAPAAATPSATVQPSGYGHPSTLTDQQAAAFQMMMLIQGHNAETVGRGRVIPAPGVHTGNDPEGTPQPSTGQWLGMGLGVDPNAASHVDGDPNDPNFHLDPAVTPPPPPPPPVAAPGIHEVR